jgi:unsaturated chondroitin disaccharide hydrolase
MQSISDNRDWISDVSSRLDCKLQKTAVRSRGKLPYTTVDGVHDDKSRTAPGWWTNGFWPGLMWLMYAGTKNEEYRKTAERSEALLDAALVNFKKLDHDAGFMWHISSGASYTLTGNEKSKNRALFAAAALFARFNIKGGFIRAWNARRDSADTAGWTIIDSMMNLPLLYWASKEVGDDRFRYVAEAHADKTLASHIRPDGSVNHIVAHDPLTGMVFEPLGGQGYGVGSAWSRGQAWALYGFVLSYIHTQKQEYLDTAKKTAHYFISNLQDNGLPLCDFRAPGEPVIYDSTAGAIAACGLIEISKNLPELEGGVYMGAAIKILKVLEEQCCNWSDDEDSILQNGTEAYHKEKTRHTPIIYGDYFFAEAIHKLRGSELLFW